MSQKRYISLVICLLASFVAVAQGHGKTMLTLVRENDSTIRLRFEGDSLLQVSFAMPRWSFHTDGEFLHFDPEMGMNLANGTPGQPALPSASTLVRLPKGSALSVSELRCSKELEVEMAPSVPPLAPITRAWVKSEKKPPYELDAQTYAKDSFLRGGELLEVENLGVMGQWQLFRLTVRPLAYNPVKKRLLQYNALRAKLKVELATKDFTEEDVLLIVSRPQFREGLQPFVQWKRQEGYDVVELYVDTADRAMVKEQMRPIFDEAQPGRTPVFTLLVGDHEQLEAFPGTMALNDESHFTDLYYADFTGDYLPETLLGRWPVNDTAELRAVVEKTLRYEQFRDIDTLQLKRVLLVAGEEYGNPAPTTTNGQVNYLKREIRLAHPDIDTLCWYNPASGSQGAAIANAIGEGAGLLNYTAHCTYNGWSHPSMTADSVAAAGTTQPTIYVNNCCQSNAFTGTGFGERLLRMPLGGAAGVIGATNTTLWAEDYYWAVGPKYPLSLEPAYDSTALGAFDGLVRQERTTETLGELLRDGNLAVTAFGTFYDKYYWEIYCLLGDPSLKPWIGVPQPTALTVDDVYNGASHVYVGGTRGARVTAMQGGELLGVADIGPLGVAAIELRRTLDTLPLIITATGVGLIPRVDTFAVDTAIDYGATLREVTATETEVHCMVENIGSHRIDSLTVVLTQMGDDTLTGARFTEQVMAIDSLLPGERLPLTLPVVVSAIGDEPLWQGTLMLWYSQGVMCEVPVSHNMTVDYPVFETSILNVDYSEAREVLPNKDYWMSLFIGSRLDGLTVKVIALPSGDTITRYNRPNQPIGPIEQPLHQYFTTPDTLCSLHVETTVYYNGWSRSENYWLEAGSRTEGFEHGFAARPWDNNGRVPWTLDSTVSHSGGLSARSGAIDHSQLSDLSLEVVLPHDDNIGFWLKTSTEPQRDRLMFLIDGVAQSPTWWGEGEWQRVAFPLEAGKHRLCWRYSKNTSDIRGEDCVWIDDISLPLARWQEVGEWECRMPSVDIPGIAPSNFEFTVFPNPASSDITVHVGRPTVLTVLDIQGRIVIPATDVNSSFTIHRSSLRPGIYFATATTDMGTMTRKIIIR